MNITFSDLSSNINAVNEISGDISAVVPKSSSKYNIFVIGDSTLTYNTGGIVSKAYAHVLSALITSNDPNSTLFSVYKIGNTGDQIRNACFNTGAHPVYLRPFTLPGDGTEVSVQVEKDNGWVLGSGADSLPGPDICNNIVGARTSNKPDLDVTIPFGYTQNISYGYSVNPVTIGGIKCHMRRQAGDGELSVKYTESTLYIKRLKPYGEDRTFVYPPQIHTGFELQHTVNDVVVIFMGTNTDNLRPTGSSASDPLNTLITGLHEIIDSLKTSKYIVVGPYNKNTALEVGNWNNYMFRMGVEFGQHFLNQLQFAVEYGLQIEGIEPTESDMSAIAAGKMPQSFMADNVHMNAAGYDLLGKQIYWKGIELGYWK